MSNLVMTRPNVLWDQLAPGEHLAQFYTRDEELFESLADFTGQGLDAGESVIVIATSNHLRGLRNRLQLDGVDLNRAMADDRYLTFDATIAISSFMKDDMPDEQLFFDFISHVYRRAPSHGRPVRVFAEMVALLLERGEARATIRLENLWSQFCVQNAINLLCAYPTAGITQIHGRAMEKICAAHSRIIFPSPVK
jgi:hypothetical protein